MGGNIVFDSCSVWKKLGGRRDARCSSSFGRCTGAAFGENTTVAAIGVCCREWREYAGGEEGISDLLVMGYS